MSGPISTTQRSIHVGLETIHHDKSYRRTNRWHRSSCGWIRSGWFRWHPPCSSRATDGIQRFLDLCSSPPSPSFVPWTGGRVSDSDPSGSTKLHKSVTNKCCAYETPAHPQLYTHKFSENTLFQLFSVISLKSKENRKVVNIISLLQMKTDVIWFSVISTVGCLYICYI